MYHLRNGLTHQYLPKIPRNNVIFISSFDEAETAKAVICEVERTPDITKVSGPSIRIDVSTMVQDIEKAYKQLKRELRKDKQMKTKAEEALSRLPELF